MPQTNTPIFNTMLKRAQRKIRRNKIKTPEAGHEVRLTLKATRKGVWNVSFCNSMANTPFISAAFVGKSGSYNFKEKRI